jgi:hypothetical protein
LNAQSIALVSAILFVVIFWLLKIFFDKRISAGQALFWLTMLTGAEVLVLFPSMVDRLSGLWGNLVPVSWITFVAMVLLIFYLLYLTIQVNKYTKLVDLARSISHLERRLREAEARNDELRRRPAGPE